MRVICDCAISWEVMGISRRRDITRTILTIHLPIVVTVLINETYSPNIPAHLQSSISLVGRSRPPYPSNYHYSALNLFAIGCSTHRHSRYQYHNPISVSLKIQVGFVFCINLSFDILLVNWCRMGCILVNKISEFISFTSC